MSSELYYSVNERTREAWVEDWADNVEQEVCDVSLLLICPALHRLRGAEHCRQIEATRVAHPSYHNLLIVPSQKRLKLPVRCTCLYYPNPTEIPCQR